MDKISERERSVVASQDLSRRENDGSTHHVDRPTMRRATAAQVYSQRGRLNRI